jgi:hypothetical protein
VNPAPLTALLAGAADRSTRHALQRLAENAAEFWNHTPRSKLAARTPAQVAVPGP